MHLVPSGTSDRAASYQEAVLPASQPSTLGSVPDGITKNAGSGEDSVQLSPAAREIFQAGRLALHVEAGDLSSDEAGGIYSHIAAVAAELVQDKAAHDGTLSDEDRKSIARAQDRISHEIANATGSIGKDEQPPSIAEARTVFEAGRVVLNQKAGNISDTQAAQLLETIGGDLQQIRADEQANGGSLSGAQDNEWNDLQTQLSRDIYTAGHTPATVPDPQL